MFALMHSKEVSIANRNPFQAYIKRFKWACLILLCNRACEYIKSMSKAAIGGRSSKIFHCWLFIKMLNNFLKGDLFRLVSMFIKVNY